MSYLESRSPIMQRLSKLALVFLLATACTLLSVQPASAFRHGVDKVVHGCADVGAQSLPANAYQLKNTNDGRCVCGLPTVARCTSPHATHLRTCIGSSRNFIPITPIGGGSEIVKPSGVF
jgi:hypothetical protein